MKTTVPFVLVSILLVLIDIVVFLITDAFSWFGTSCFIIAFVVSGFMFFYRATKVSSFVKEKYPDVYASNLSVFQYDYNGGREFNIFSSNIQEPEIKKLIAEVMEFLLITVLSFQFMAIDPIVVFIIKYLLSL